MIPPRDNARMTSEREDDSGIESSTADSGDNTVYIRISVPELKLQKCLQFSQEDSVWTAKQRVLSTLAKDLKDGLNYGLYCPPINGRAGKFLDEERPLKDYPLPGPIGFLEFKFKRRVYKLMNIKPQKLKQLHTKANLKQFMDSVKRNEVEKVTKATTKGLDPNFHDHDSGETPLTMAATLSKPRQMLLTLVSGGAHLDFRNKAGHTPMHRAARGGNKDAIRTLLDLSASPNYKDIHGLTPLYHCVCESDNSDCVEMLLHDHAIVGTTDDRGWTEVHQACRHGRIQHLEHLLFYGAEMNVQNSSGNTPLHVCAVNNQESCARVLLFRGTDKNIQNYANNDAFQVAVISGNLELANIIKTFKADDVVPFQEVPKYNEKRRTTISQATLSNLVRSRSDPRLNLLFAEQGHQPASPAPSNSSLPQFMRDGGLYDPESTGMYNGHVHNKYDHDHYSDTHSDSPRSMSISSTGSMSGSFASDPMVGVYQQPMPRSVSIDVLDRRSSLPPDMRPFLRCFSRRSSMCGHGSLSRHGSEYIYPRQRLYQALPGRRFICIKNYKPQNEAELALRKGQFIEVLSHGEQGYWEGKTSQGYEGWFPRNCVQEVQMRQRSSYPQGSKNYGDSDSVVVKRHTLEALVRDDDNAPRTVVLQKGKNGFGFVLRGAKSQTTAGATLEFTPTPDFPALQYLDRVDRGSMADKVGLKPGDFVLEINHESVVNATHEHTVRLIKNSGDTLAMKVITVKPVEGFDSHMDGTRTLPIKKKGPPPPKRNPQTYLTATGSLGVQAKSMIDSLAELDEEEGEEGMENFGALEELRELEKLDQTLSQYEIDERHTEGYATGVALAKGIDPQNKTASISRRTKRLTSVPLDEIFERTDNARDDTQHVSAGGANKPVVPVPGYSPGELNKSKSQSPSGTTNMGRAKSTPNLAPGMTAVTTSEGEYTRNITRVDVGREGNVSHSYAISRNDTPSNVANVRLSTVTSHDKVSYDGIYAVPFKGPKRSDSSDRIDNQGYAQTSRHIPPRPQEAPPLPPSQGMPPPPSHPPPTPPSDNGSGEVVQIKTQYQHGYANVSEDIMRRKALEAKPQESPYESSFRPNTGARLVKEPAVPPPVHTRTSSITSSMSSASEQSANARMTSHYSTPEPTVTRVEARVDTHYQKTREIPEPEPDYNDPEPDYDRGRAGSGHSHDSWGSRGSRERPPITMATQVPPPPSPKPQASPSQPKLVREEESTETQFGNAIKMAALAREKRAQEEATQPPPPPVQHQVKTTSYATPATPPSSIPPPPPGAPPPPPIMPPPEQTPGVSPVLQARRSPPPHVKKQLEETKKREESHAALMAAVMKRRNIVDNSNQEQLAENIEKRINKDRRMQTTLYKSDQTREEVKTAPSPAPLLASPPKPEPAKVETKPEVKTPQPNGKVETKPSPPKKSPPPPPPVVKPANGQATAVSNGSPAGAPKRDSVGNGSTDFLAMAEKARQEYLQKKGLSTLERKNKEEEELPKKREAPKPPEPKNDHPSARYGNARGGGPQDDPSNIASMVAQRAMERQKSHDGVERNNNTKPEPGSQRIYKANVPAGGGTRLSNDPVTPGKSPVKVQSTDWSEKTVEIKGATVDYSNTDTPRTSRAPSVADTENMSVSDRLRMFENGQSKQSGSKFVFSAKQDSRIDDIPPPMIPPPLDFSSNGHSVNGNGHIPNGTGPRGGSHLPRDSSPFHSHEQAVQGKLSQANRGRFGPDSVHSNGVATMVMVPEPEVADPGLDVSAIPPPPLFDEYQNVGGAPAVHDDAVSMVSSVSTLSTLSSADHDVYLHDSPHHSRAASGGEIPPGVPPPPPPGFDDSPNKDDNSGYADFIPPPMEFDAATDQAPSTAATSLRSVLKGGSPTHSSGSHSVSYPAKTKPFQTKPIDTWSIADVGDWLDSLQLGEHRSKFSAKNINGQKLMQMGRAELIALGVTQVGHRMNIERAIKKALMQK